ncbi:hypothetical protein ACFORO_12705 [Amycolatopsis halotolerans]|uniref:Uncharacterized protein n=1 Tax=Amycolatopsis halotolerans TaxID=330083 RepID=A0ABV7QGN3_9PSEU
MTAWLVGSREHITPEQARDAVAWLSDTLGTQAADRIRTGGLIGHPDAPDVTFDEGVEHYSGASQFTLSIMLLNGALVSTLAMGDPEWLRQLTSNRQDHRTKPQSCACRKDGVHGHESSA